MTTTQLSLLIVGAFTGGAAFGLTGFAYGVVGSLFLHHAFQPSDVVFLLVGGGLLLNVTFLPRFWREVDLRGSLPFIGGAAFGLPIGVLSLRLLNAESVRLITCGLVMAYCTIALLRRGARPIHLSSGVGLVADAGIGFLGGVVGGVAGLGPLLPSVWYGLRGYDKRTARGLTQPFGLFVQGTMLAWFTLSTHGNSTALHALGIAVLPMMLGAWLGAKVFEAMSTSSFQRVILWLALGGAITLLARQLIG